MKRLAEPVADLVATGEAVECRVGDWDALCDPAAAALAESPPSSATPRAAVPFRQPDLGREETRGCCASPTRSRWGSQSPSGSGATTFCAARRRPHRRARRPEVRSQGPSLAGHWEGRQAPAQLARHSAALARTTASAEHGGRTPRGSCAAVRPSEKSSRRSHRQSAEKSGPPAPRRRGGPREHRQRARLAGRDHLGRARRPGRRHDGRAARHRLEHHEAPAPRETGRSCSAPACSNRTFISVRHLAEVLDAIAQVRRDLGVGVRALVRLRRP